MKYLRDYVSYYVHIWANSSFITQWIFSKINSCIHPYRVRFVRMYVGVFKMQLLLTFPFKAIIVKGRRARLISDIIYVSKLLCLFLQLIYRNNLSLYHSFHSCTFSNIIIGHMSKNVFNAVQNPTRKCICVHFVEKQH